MLRFRSECFRPSGLGLAGLLDAVTDGLQTAERFLGGYGPLFLA